MCTNRLARAVLLTTLVGSGNGVVGAPLNDTGITFGGRYPSGTNADCSGATIEAQDCAHGRDATHDDDSDGHAGYSYTKVDARGNRLPADAVVWACVLDNVTGLLWEAKTREAGIHNEHNTYRWGGTSALTGGGGYRYPDWDGLVHGSREERLCGRDDWRAPTIEELEGIVNYQRVDPAVDMSYFRHNQVAHYWSATPHAGSSAKAMVVWFGYGKTDEWDRTGSHRVRLVSGGSRTWPVGTQCTSIPESTPTSRFVLHDDGTVTDVATGLMWQRCVRGLSGESCEQGAPTGFTWQAALDFVGLHNNGNGLAGHSDWRIPNVRELNSLVEHSCYDVAINRSVFPNTPRMHTRTSSPDAEPNRPDFAWIVHFGVGETYSGYKWIGYYHLRLVRDVGTPPDIIVEPSHHDYGFVQLGTSRIAPIAIHNAGQQDLIVERIWLEEEASDERAGADFTFTAPIPEFPLTIQEGSSEVLLIEFTPSTAYDWRSQYFVSTAGLLMQSNDPDQSTTRASLTGRGIIDAVVEPSALEFLELAGTLWHSGLIELGADGKSGGNKLSALTDMVLTAGQRYLAGDSDAACDDVRAAHKHTDGRSRPKDFVYGEGASQLAEALVGLLASYGCTELP